MQLTLLPILTPLARACHFSARPIATAWLSTWRDAEHSPHRVQEDVRVWRPRSGRWCAGPASIVRARQLHFRRGVRLFVHLKHFPRNPVPTRARWGPAPPSLRRDVPLCFGRLHIARARTSGPPCAMDGPAKNVVANRNRVLAALVSADLRATLVVCTILTLCVCSFAD